MSGFWQWIYYLMHITQGCTAVTQSTHSTPATRYPIAYSGNCVQAWIVAVQSHGAIAWIINAVS